MVTWLPLNSWKGWILVSSRVRGHQRCSPPPPPPPIHIWEAAGMQAGGHCGPKEGGPVSAEPSHSVSGDWACPFRSRKPQTVPGHCSGAKPAGGAGQLRSLGRQKPRKWGGWGSMHSSGGSDGPWGELQPQWAVALSEHGGREGPRVQGPCEPFPSASGEEWNQGQGRFWGCPTLGPE